MKYFLFFTLFSSALIAQTFDSFIQQLEKQPQSQRTASVQRFLFTTKFTSIIERDSLLHFIYFGKATIVLVNGNIQHWNYPDTMKKIECGEKSLFHRSFVVPSDARLDYQFVVDGNYQIDSLNPRITPSGFGSHSEVRMPKFIPSPYIAYRDSIPHGTIDSVVLYKYITSPLKQYKLSGRTIKVYLPPGYDTLSNLHSVYIHDGMDAMNFGLVPTIIDNLIAEKRISPTIAIFVPPVRRVAEYRKEYRDKFVAMLCDEIVPMIDKKYKTDTLKYKRAMIGASDGGHISLYTAFSRSDVFHNVAGQSSTISPWLEELTRKRASENIFSPKFKIYFDCGTYDVKSNVPIYGYYELVLLNRHYSELLSSLRVPHYYKEVNDGHEWASWRERIPEMLIYFYGQ